MHRNRTSFRSSLFPLQLAVLALAVAPVPKLLAQSGVGSNTVINNSAISDWTDRTVVFSSPDSSAAVTLPQLNAIQKSARFLNQQKKIQAANHRKKHHSPPPPSMDRDWSVTGLPGALVNGTSPAKFTFDVTASPDCVNDFVVLGLNVGGAGGNANLVGLNNLYASTGGTGYCSGTAPSVKFAYYSSGKVETSPALSLDGTKVAFVESKANSVLHILTLATTGTLSAPTLITGDAEISLGAQVTLSSPFIDYDDDIAYVGDNNGILHKITGVFHGTPTEASTPWPVTVKAGANLTSPTYDSVTGNIFIIDGNKQGLLYSVSPAGVVTSTAVFAGCNAVDPPIVDSTTGRVYAIVGQLYRASCTTAGSSNGVLFQSDTSASFTHASAIDLGAKFTAYDGAFDQLYFNSVSTGHMYLCVDGSLRRISFSTNPPVSLDSSSLSIGGSGNTCSPLTEFYNSTANKDWIFVGSSAGTVFNIDVTSGAFPSAITQSITATGGSSGIVVDNDFEEPFWQTSQSYALNALITDSNGNVQRVTTPGTSGAVQPVWNPTIGATTADGSVIWTNQGPNQTSSIYYGFLGASTVVKVTQAALQ